MTAPLDLQSLRKTYPGRRKQPPRVALDGLSLLIGAGEWVALLGPNGSGKSTLVRVISGADVPDDGQALVFGHDLATGAAAERRAALSRMAIVFQRPGLDPLLTVQENLLAAASLFGLTGEARQERIRSLAERLGFSDRLHDRVSGLSGGYQRRVDLARALLHEPELLILDEATAGLDHQSRISFLEAVAEIRARNPRMTVLMTTHLMDEAERADRVVMMAGGRVLAQGSPQELRASSGGRILRISPLTDEIGRESAALVQQAGFALQDGENQHLLARVESGDLQALEGVVLELTRRGIAFEVAPPNLGDAYLALTGVALSQAGGEKE